MNKSKRDERRMKQMHTCFDIAATGVNRERCANLGYNAGYDAAMAEAKVLVEALEEIKLGQGCYDKGHEFILDTQDMINIATNALAAYKKD